MFGTEILTGGDIGAFIYIAIIIVIDIALIHLNRTFFKKI